MSQRQSQPILTTNDKVVAMIGPATSGATKAALPNVTKAQVPLVTPSGTDDAITVSSDKVQGFAFRSCFPRQFPRNDLSENMLQTIWMQKAIILGR